MASTKHISTVISAQQHPGSNAGVVSHPTDASFVHTHKTQKFPSLSLLKHHRHLIIPALTHSLSAYLHTCRPTAPSHPHGSIMKKIVCPRSFQPPPSAVCHSTPTNVELIPFAYQLIPIMMDSSNTVSLSLHPYHSPRLDSNTGLAFAPINCRSILDKFSHFKSFAASLNLNILFVTATWTNKSTPNGVTSLAIALFM